MPQLNGQLFIDLNGNATIDAEDNGSTLGGWTVFIDMDGSGTLNTGDISATTDSSGGYTITGIPLGDNYKIGVLDKTDSTFLTTFPGATNDYYLSASTGTVTFTRGVVEKQINFEISSTNTLSDNLAITKDVQPWEADGFRFWTDNDNDNILDSKEGINNTLFLEKTNRTTTDSGNGFVNDFRTGPFVSGRVPRFDTEQSGTELETYFLRGGGLYSDETIVTFLTEYTSPAISGSGTLWDIDTTWNEFLEGKTEQWKVEFLSASVDSNGQLGTMVVRDTLISPKGQPVWVPNTTEGIEAYNSRVAEADRGVLQTVTGVTGWLYNPNSLDAKAWHWSFDRPQADINFVKFSFIGEKRLDGDVGFAFDKFKTYSEDIQSKNFGVFQLATIGDTLFNDLNANGIQELGDTGISNTTVYLLDKNGSVVGTDTTDTNGKYSFDVTPGTYSVKFDLPAGYDGFSLADQGGDDDLDSDVNSAGVTGPYTVKSGEVNNTIDAGVYELATIGDTLFNDLNANGIQELGDTGISNTTVYLLDKNGSVVGTDTTDTNGKYSFDVTPGTYSVKFDLPTGYDGFSLADQGGDDDLDSDVNSAGVTGTYTVKSGEVNNTIDAGVYELATIGDFVFEDKNGNGIQDTGEEGVAGVTVTLLDGEGTVIPDGAGDPITTTTKADGKYSFEVIPGTYSVKFSAIPAKYTGFSPFGQTGLDDTFDSDADPSTGITDTVTVTSGETNNDLDAGLLLVEQIIPASIGNFVWADANKNGVQDDGVNSGIAGVTVNLKTAGTDGIIGTGDDTTVSTQQTQADGSYLFNGLNPGSYYVEFVQPTTGYTGFTTPDVGTDDALDSDAGTGGRTGAINLASGENDLTVDAGLLPNQPGSIGNFVWADTNRDGVQNDGVNSGIAGVTVNLKTAGNDGIIGTGDDTTVSTQQTQADGSYLFNGLNPGSYYVEFVQPTTGYTGFTTPDVGTDDALDSDAGTGGRTGAINLASGQNDLTVDAGLLPQLFLGDFVWLDSNRNGVQDGDEPGVENVTVNLLDSNGNVIDWVTTQADGSYQFPVNPGTYSVQFVPPAGYNFTSANQGNDALDSDANTTGQTNQVIITTSSNNTLDAGLVPNDLSIAKTNNSTTVSVGQQITYIIEARNNGTLTATNALVSDVMPANLTNVSWTSQAFGGATGNELSGTGNINDFVTLTGGSRIVYTVTGTVAAPTTTLGSFATFNFNGNTSTSGTLGNTRSFTSNDNSITVTTRAFSRVDGTNGSWAAAYLGSYSGGLGVTDSGESGSAHRVDNVGGRDNYVVFQFSESVVLDRARLEAVLDDSDISVWIGNTSNPLTSLSDSILSGLGFNEVNDTTLSTDRWANVNAGNRAGNTLVIAASTADTSPDDKFKIRSLEVNKVVPGVSALINTATVTAPNGFIDTNPDNNTSTDNDPIGTTTPTKLTIGDYVWKDGNQNGLQDTGSQGVKCVTVKLLNSNNQVIATTQTNNSGFYSFLVDPGTYSLDFDAPSGYAFTRRDAGSNDAIDSDVDPLTGRTAQFTVTTSNNLSLDAGLVCRPSEHCDEGFTPGYWKNNGINQGRWPATGYTTNSNYESVFGVSLSSSLKGSIGNGDQILTFLEALNANGNTDTQALLRHSTAGILNASHPDVAYFYSVGEVIAYTQGAFAGTQNANTVKNLFETRNQAGGSF